MISYIEKDITTIEKGVIIHGCNTHGVMGSGVAYALRQKWPIIFDNYAKICQQAENDRKSLIGSIDPITIENSKLYVINCFTQEDYGRSGKKYANPHAIESAMGFCLMFAAFVRLPLYMPKIGAGLGGLDWKTEVEPIVQQFELMYDKIDIYICTI